MSEQTDIAMKSLHFGAGKIGRGFIGATLSRSGYKVTFADAVESLVEAINQERGYDIHITGERNYLQHISDINAVSVSSSKCAEEIADTDLITTAVGLTTLPAIAPVIAEGLRLRHRDANDSPLNIICCENGIRATSQLKKMLLDLLDPSMQEWALANIGFVDCCVDRIVPIITLERVLDVAVEEFFEWDIDNTAIKGELPPIEGMQRVDNIEAYIYRKLFTLNTAHCSTAYLGARRGHKYIHEAVCDTEVRTIVEGIMQECSEALVAEFGLDAESQRAYCQQILHRFANRAIGDTVSRVARDPMRKLSPHLYFASPIVIALRHRVPTRHLSMAVVAALKYRSNEDSQSAELSSMIEREGVKSTVKRVCGIDDKDFLEQTEQIYNSF